ncbi:MAG: hypothetical protein WA957_11670 [Alteraurantiacibacter sp.]
MGKKRAFALAIAALSLSGCATVLKGVDQQLAFQSIPSGATIQLASGKTCETPCSFELRRGRDTMVTYTLDGYDPATVYIQSRTGGETSVFNGVIGGVVDASTGAANDLYPSPVYVRLVRQGGSEKALLLDQDGQFLATLFVHNDRVGKTVRESLIKQGLLDSDTEGSD